jgi:aspartate aminotransferase
MKAEGLDVCGFGAGEPDFDTPEHIKDAAIAALQGGFTKYTPSAGLPELRQAIADKLQADNGLTYKPSQIVVSTGAKHSCYNTILATCQQGDEVIIPAPYWVSYPDMVRLAGAEPVIVPTTERNGWKMRAEDFENAMTPRTKMLILNSPNNPSGAVYTREELEGIVAVAAEEEIYILSDEIYEKLVYDEAQHVSVASLSKEAADLTDHGERLQQSVRDDRLAARLSRGAGSGGEGSGQYPEPQHVASDVFCAAGRARGLEGRPAGARRYAR